MKRSGQWLFMLWVAAALLYPQAVISAARFHDQIANFIQNQEQSQPLVADCGFVETDKADTKPCMVPDDAENTGFEGLIGFYLPLIAVEGRLVANPIQETMEAARGMFPFVCGPPAQTH